jgi:NADH-quinone oxidoreductase subunit G
MLKQVTLTIDGKQVTVPEGTLVVDAAKQVALDIPVFCYHPKMEPVGMCRMCLVEIGRPVVDRASGQVVIENGQPKIQFLPKLETACTNVVSDGMVVLSQSAKALEGQKSTVEFLLTSHPLDCPICDKGGECPLQNLTMAYGPGKSRFLYDEKMHLAKQKPLGELIYLDQERCIQCARCIRFQDEIVGESVLGFDDRARSMQIISLSEPGFDSVFSGNTTDICPVGALTTADFRFQARPWELGASASICTQCPVGCNTTLNTRREASSGGDVVIKRVMPRQNEEVNEIWICDKGRFAYQYPESKTRLMRPFVRRDGKLTRASWNTALETAGEKLGAARKNAVVLASGRLSNEDLYNLKTLADGLGGQAVLYTDIGGGDLTMQVGVGAGTNLGTLGKGDTILVAASDLYEEAPIWWLRVKQAADRGATLIVANPRGTKLDKFATFSVRYEYGDEVKSVQGLLKKSKVGDALTQAGNLVIFFGSEGLGLTGSSNLAAACAKLLQDTEHVGKANNGLIGVWRRANDQGAWELGFRPSEKLQSVFDKADVVYVIGADPIGDGLIKMKNKKQKPFLIVQELLETETTAMADVVLPVQAYSEREGTYTSGERRVQRFHAAEPPKGETRPDFAITAQVAKEAGIIMESTSPKVVFDILSVSVKAFEDLNYAKLAQVSPQWPIVGRGDLYYGGTTYENMHGLGVQLLSGAQRGETVRVPRVQKEAAIRPKEKELLAVPITKLYDRGHTVRPAPLLDVRVGELSVSLHPEAAERLGVQAGKRVKISFDGVSGEALVKIDATISAHVALVPRSMGLAIHEPIPAKVK